MSTPTVRRPEYTGENRCWPCTAVNGAILAVVVLGVAVRWPVIAAVLAVAGATIIWLRGYLVPFTPQFAPRLVARLPGTLFEHAPTSDSLGDMADANGEAILEGLAAAGVVTVDAERLALSEDFAAAWKEHMASLAESHDDALVTTAKEHVDGVESARIETTGDETYLVVTSPESTAWLRQPVAIAEVGAACALSGTGYPRESRALAAHAVCAFLEMCPVCGEDVVEGAADGCCGHTVPGQEPPTVLACEACGVAFYTFEPEDGGATS